MKNSEKAELRADVRDLVKQGYSKEDAVKTLVEYGYVKSTASRYWDVFSKKPSQKTGRKE